MPRPEVVLPVSPEKSSQLGKVQDEEVEDEEEVDVPTRRTMAGGGLSAPALKSARRFDLEAALAVWEASWKPSWTFMGHLGLSWGNLGASWAVLGFLGLSCGFIGLFWAFLGAS